MFLVLQGIESATHRDTLASVLAAYPELAGVDLRAGISWKGLRSRRLGPRYLADIAGRWPIVLDAGVSQKTQLASDAALDSARQYYELALGSPEVGQIVEYEHPALDEAGLAAVHDYRATDPRVLPVWSATDQLVDLRRMLVGYDRVAMNGQVAIKDRRIGALLRAARASTSLLLGIGRLDEAHFLGASGVSTQTWLSAAKFREFLFFDGRELIRGSSAEREFLAKKYRQALEALGFDIGLLAREDAREYTRLAAWSFLSWVKHLDATEPVLVAHSAEGAEAGLAAEIVPAAHSGPPPVKPAAPTTRLPVVLPGYGAAVVDALEETEDGRAAVVAREVLTTTGSTVRVCDSCFLAANCPAFTPAANCAFHFPVEVRTPAQIRAVLASMIELQATRVAFSRFAEEITGGDLDPNVGTEMDRLFRMAEKAKKVEEQHSHEQLTVSVTRDQSRESTVAGAGGVLSALFGSRPAPAIPADSVIADAID